MSNEGILSQVSLGKEITRGTAVVPTNSIGVLPSDGVVTEQESTGVETIDTTPALNKDFISGVREYNGSFEMNTYPDALGYILYSGLGSVSTSTYASESNVYLHEFSEAIVKPSYTLEQKIGEITERFAGTVVTSFNLQLSVGNPLVLSFTTKSLSQEDETAITPAYETTKVFDWTDVQSITLGGTDIKCCINEMNVEYNNNLGNFHGLCGSANPSKLYTQGSTVEGSINAYLDEDIKDLKQSFLNKTNQEMVITLTQNTVIGSSSYNTLIITLPKVSLDTYTYPITNEYTAVESGFKCASDQTDGQIKVSLINQVAEY